MSVYNYLYYAKSKEFICLGKKVESDSRKLEGPVVWLKSGRYYLPLRILSLLLDAFKSSNSDAILLPDYELFDSGKYLTDEEPGIEIGGDTDLDLPLTKYLPELETEKMQKEIMSYPELKIE